MKEIYLDFQATTPIDSRVLEAMEPWFQRPANPHAIEHMWGQKALGAVENAQTQVASLVNVDPKGVIFTANATEAANIIIRSFADSQKKILTSAIEHPCVLETVQSCKADGAAVEIIPVGSDGIINIEACANLIDGSSLVSIMSVNNEVGTIQPIEDIAILCASAGVPFHTDATQAAGRVAFDMSTGISFATLSSHKIYGPAGIGAICAIPDMLDKLKPIITGGGQQEGRRPGTLSTALCVGFGEACAIAERERKKDYELAEALAQLFLDEIDNQDIEYSINGTMEHRIPHNLNICFNNVNAKVLIEMLPNLAISTGSACSSGAINPSSVLMAMGLPVESIQSSIRIGFGRTTTKDEIIGAASQIVGAVQVLKES